MTDDRAKFRSFGWILGACFTLIAVFPLIRGDSPRGWAIAVAAPFLLLGTLAPWVLRIPHHYWMRLGTLLGWINTRVILSFVYFLVVTPIGALMRALGKDPLSRKLEHSRVSYRVEKNPRDARHYETMF